MLGARSDSAADAVGNKGRHFQRTRAACGGENFNGEKHGLRIGGLSLTRRQVCAWLSPPLQAWECEAVCMCVALEHSLP